MTTNSMGRPRSFSLSLHAGRGDRLDEYRAELERIADRLDALTDDGEDAWSAAGHTRGIIAKLEEADAYAAQLSPVWWAVETLDAGTKTVEELRLALEAYLRAGPVPLGRTDGTALALHIKTSTGVAVERGISLGCGRCDQPVAFWSQELLTVDLVNAATRAHGRDCPGPSQEARASLAEEQMTAVRAALVDAGYLSLGDVTTDPGALLRRVIPAWRDKDGGLL